MIEADTATMLLRRPWIVKGFPTKLLPTVHVTANATTPPDKLKAATALAVGPAFQSTCSVVGIDIRPDVR